MANCQNNMRCGCSSGKNHMSHMYQHRTAYTTSPSMQRDTSQCHDDPFADMPLAMAYVPWQHWCNIYDICEGFQRGTIFRELDKPFLARGGCNR